MLQVGVDCEEIGRFRKLPFGRNEGFYRKIFTPREIEYCTSFRDPYPRFAARFAAKEATIKALNSIAKPLYAEIEILKDKKEQPKIYISKSKFNRKPSPTMSLSLAHSNSYAIAFVVVADNKKAVKTTEQALKENLICVKRKIRDHLRVRY